MDVPSPRDAAQPVVSAFLAAQTEMYAGGSVEPLVALLAHDVVWHVPGASAIAGDHRGREAVLAYFRTRRALAGGRIEVIKHAELAHGDVVVQLADGRARIGGEEVEWRTAGVYRVAEGTIAEAWLVPLEAAAFDRVWAGRRHEPTAAGTSGTSSPP